MSKKISNRSNVEFVATAFSLRKRRGIRVATNDVDITKTDKEKKNTYIFFKNNLHMFIRL